MLHKLAIGGAVLVGKAAVVAGHSLAHLIGGHVTTSIAVDKALLAGGHVAAKTALAHPLLAAGAVMAPVVAIAYLDLRKLGELHMQDEHLMTENTIKLSILGKLVTGEFTTLTGPAPASGVILNGLYDTEKQELLTRHLVRAKRLSPELRAAFNDGKLVVCA